MSAIICLKHLILFPSCSQSFSGFLKSWAGSLRRLLVIIPHDLTTLPNQRNPSFRELASGRLFLADQPKPSRTSFTRASLVSLPRDLGPHTVRQLRPYSDSMFALIGRLPTSLHVSYHGGCRLLRSLSLSANTHCRRPSTRVLLCSAESALTAEGNERSTAEKIERMLNKALKPIRDDLKATRDDSGIVKDDLRIVKDDLGIVKADLGIVKDDLGAVKV